MWRFLRKRRALADYRTTLYKYLRQTFGRKRHYSSDEVRDGVAVLRLSTEFVSHALGMFCDRATFEAFHVVTGERCDYDLVRNEVVAHVAQVPLIHGAQFDAGRTHHGAQHDVGMSDVEYDLGGFGSGWLESRGRHY